MSTYEDESNPEILKWQRDNWQETARQYAINAAYHQEERFALLRWIKNMHDENIGGISALIPDTIVQQFKLIEFWESER